MFEGGFCIRLIFQKIEKKGDKKMKRNNLNLGLAILLTALIFVQGAMAYPTKEVAC
jgi:hypothetical protein